MPLCCVDEQGKVARRACAHVMLFLVKVGAEHNIVFMCCQCETLPVTMVRAHIWPAFPQHPKLAFTFEFLDWAEALLLECQVALKDLCKALYFKCPHLVRKVRIQLLKLILYLLFCLQLLQRKDIYPSLIDAFEEYRYNGG